jgi:hypothetical protein
MTKGATWLFSVIFCRNVGNANANIRSAYKARAVVLALAIAAYEVLFLGCGNPHAMLQLTAPSTTMAGSPFTVTVTALVDGNPDSIINSRLQFSSSDLAAVLPPDYHFTPADAGSHTFTDAFTLITPGEQTISAKIHDANGINGSANISVRP